MIGIGRPLGANAGSREAEPVGYLTQPREEGGEPVNLPVWEMNSIEVEEARQRFYYGEGSANDALSFVEGLEFSIIGGSSTENARSKVLNGIEYMVCDYIFTDSHTATYSMDILNLNTFEIVTHTGNITVEFPDETSEMPDEIAVVEQNSDGSYSLNTTENTPSPVSYTHLTLPTSR